MFPGVSPLGIWLENLFPGVPVLKVRMKRKFLLHYVKELFKL